MARSPGLVSLLARNGELAPPAQHQADHAKAQKGQAARFRNRVVRCGYLRLACVIAVTPGSRLVAWTTVASGRLDEPIGRIDQIGVAFTVDEWAKPIIFIGFGNHDRRVGILVASGRAIAFCLLGDIGDAAAALTGCRLLRTGSVGGSVGLALGVPEARLPPLLPWLPRCARGPLWARDACCRAALPAVVAKPITGSPL